GSIIKRQLVRNFVSEGSCHMKEWYWVAISGGAVIPPSPFPTSEPPGGYPCPDQWLGYPSLGAAVDAQQFLFDARLEDVAHYLEETYPEMLKAGKVAYHRPKNPSPPLMYLGQGMKP